MSAKNMMAAAPPDVTNRFHNSAARFSEAMRAELGKEPECGLHAMFAVMAELCTALVLGGCGEIAESCAILLLSQVQQARDANGDPKRVLN